MVSNWAFIHKKKTGSLMLFRVSATLCHKALRWTDFFFALNGFTEIISRQKTTSCSSVQFIILPTKITDIYIFLIYLHSYKKIKANLECSTVCENHFLKIIWIYRLQPQSLGRRLAKPSVCTVINLLLCGNCLIKQTFCRQRHLFGRHSRLHVSVNLFCCLFFKISHNFCGK